MQERMQHYKLALKIIKSLRDNPNFKEQLYLWNSNPDYGILSTNYMGGKSILAICEFMVRDYRGWFWNDIFDEIADQLIPDDQSKSIELCFDEIRLDLCRDPSQHVDRFVNELINPSEFTAYPLSLSINTGNGKKRLAELELYDIEKIERILENFVEENE